MNFAVIGLGLACGLVLGAVGVSLFLLWRAHALVRNLQDRAQRREKDTAELTERVLSLSSRVQELERAPMPTAAVPVLPRAGMNLNKRSHALRMHRQGGQLEEIATALELPRQEIELLIKVHQIVMANVS
jgi:hypothetical protein